MQVPGVITDVAPVWENDLEAEQLFVDKWQGEVDEAVRQRDIRDKEEDKDEDEDAEDDEGGSQSQSRKKSKKKGKKRKSKD